MLSQGEAMVSKEATLAFFSRRIPPPPGDTFQFNDTMCKGFVETSIDRGVEGG